MEGQSYRCDTEAVSGDEYGLIGQARGLADQSYRWYVGAKDHRLYGLVWLIGKKPHTEHWVSDYKEVAAGYWLPMTQGYELYGDDSNGESCLQARRELKVLEVRVNEQLPDELFRIELKKGIQVVDSRSGHTTRYTYEPDPPELVGKVLPELSSIAVQLSTELSRRGKTLVCFWDVEQRPSRHCIKKLAEQANALAAQNITVVALQASKVDQKVLDKWLQEHHIPFVVGTVGGDTETIKYSWGVRSLPWLLLTDQAHMVCAEGFGLAELSTRSALLTPGLLIAEPGNVAYSQNFEDGPDGSQRVAQKRHRQGYNSLFLDWQVEYVNIDKQDARQTRRLELRRWKWFYEGK
jgi:hypothetical protein